MERLKQLKKELDFLAEEISKANNSATEKTLLYDKNFHKEQGERLKKYEKLSEEYQKIRGF